MVRCDRECSKKIPKHSDWSLADYAHVLVFEVLIICLTFASVVEQSKRNQLEINFLDRIHRNLEQHHPPPPPTHLTHNK